MFCSQCGQELNNDVKFCSNCGSKAIQGNENEPSDNTKDEEHETNSSDEQTIIFTINDIDVNMSEIINRFGSDKIKAIKYFRDATGLGLADAKDCIDDAYKIHNNQSSPGEQKKSCGENIEWDAPAQFYQEYAKYYIKKPKIVSIAKHYGIITDEDELIMHYGTYYPNIYCVLIFVKYDEIVISRTNYIEPQFNIIRRFSLYNQELGNTYNKKKFIFEANELLGFKMNSAVELGLVKEKLINFEIIKKIVPSEAEEYFRKQYKTSCKKSILLLFFNNVIF